MLGTTNVKINRKNTVPFLAERYSSLIIIKTIEDVQSNTNELK